MKRVLLRVVTVSAAILLLFTIYCLFCVPDLCELANTNPQTTAFMGRKLEQWQEKEIKKRINQRWVPLSAISRHLRNAVIVTEDPTFYRHHGLDVRAIWLAAKENWENREIVTGASTITQQLVKNLYLSPSQNPFRKWKEAILAVRLEQCVKKSRILELYLNVIEWGDSVYGAEAASRRYFGKPAAALNPGEAALLAAMIRNPIAFSPYKRNSRLIKNKNATLRSMWKLGMLNKFQYESAVNAYIHLR